MIGKYLKNDVYNISDIYLLFLQSYFQVPKDARLNCTHLFITKTPKEKGGLPHIAFNHLSDIDLKNLWFNTKNV